MEAIDHEGMKLAGHFSPRVVLLSGRTLQGFPSAGARRNAAGLSFEFSGLPVRARLSAACVSGMGMNFGERASAVARMRFGDSALRWAMARLMALATLHV